MKKKTYYIFEELSPQETKLAYRGKLNKNIDDFYSVVTFYGKNSVKVSGEGKVAKMIIEYLEKVIPWWRRNL